MAKDIPFDDDTLVMLMGLGDRPEKPGMHGDTDVLGMPEGSAEDVLRAIQDLIKGYFDEKPAGDGEDKEDKGEPKEAFDEVDIDEEEEK